MAYSLYVHNDSITYSVVGYIKQVHFDDWPEITCDPAGINFLHLVDIINLVGIFTKRTNFCDDGNFFPKASYSLFF